MEKIALLQYENESTYCPFQKVGHSKMDFQKLKNRFFHDFFQKFQMNITFFLCELCERHRYEKGSIFHELSENVNYLSESLN